MSKLSNIFHNNTKYSTNNRNTFNTFNSNKKKVVNKSNNMDNLINYFNKRIIIELNNNEKKEGILLSKRNDYLLLDSGEYINIKDIISIK